MAGCETKKGVVKISNQLKQCHSLTLEQHASALKNARVVASERQTALATPLLKGQTSLKSFSQQFFVIVFFLYLYYNTSIKNNYKKLKGK